MAPDIEHSTREERLAFVRNEWKCLHRSYGDITLAIRQNGHSEQSSLRRIENIEGTVAYLRKIS